MLKNVATKLGSLRYQKEALHLERGIIRAICSGSKFNEEEVSEVLPDVLNLVAPLPDLKGILRCQMALTELLSQLASAVGLSHDEVEEVISLVERCFQALNASPRKKFYGQRVHIEKSPVFAFHVSASTGALDKKEATPLYREYCVTFFKAIQKVCVADLKKDSIEYYLRAFRYFFDFTDEKIKNDAALLKQHHGVDAFLKKLINAAFENYQESRGNKTRQLDDSAEGYKSAIERVLFSEKKLHPHRGQTREQVAYPYEQIGDEGLSTFLVQMDDWAAERKKSSGSGGDGSQIFIEAVAATVIVQDLIPEDLLKDEYVDPDERICLDFFYDHSPESSEEPKTRKPSLNFRYADFLNLRSHIFFFDSEYLRLNHYAILHAVFDSRWPTASGHEKCILLSLLMLGHIGVRPEDLLLAGYETRDLDAVEFSKHPLIIGVERDICYMLKPAIVTYQKEHSSKEHCRKTSDIIKIAFPRKLSRFIGEYAAKREGGGYFFSLEPPFKETAINLDNMRKYLNQINRAAKMDITPHKFARSFFPLYCSRYNLDPIIGCYVSSQHRRLFASQLRYTYVDAQRVQNEYHSTSALVFKAIEKNIQVSPGDKLLAGSGRPAGLVTGDVSGETLTETVAEEYHASETGYGSIFIPRIEDVKAYIGSLKAGIKQCEWNRMVDRHNLYVAYTFLCLQFSCAYRARVNIPYTFREFAKADVIVNADKLSKVYFEERLLPVTVPLKGLAHNMRTGFREAQKYIARKINPAILRFVPERFFFFIGSDGIAKDFSLTAMTDFLREAGLEYPYDLKMPRHFVRTFLFENDVACDVIDAWLGHHHTAKEPLGVCSATAYNEFEAIALPTVEKMLADLGIEPISYLPKGDNLW